MTDTTLPKVVPAFEVEVEPGNLYRFMEDISTRGGHIHLKGSYLLVSDMTLKAPYGELGEKGNWVCVTQFGTSVWATLEACIARGYMQKVEITQDVLDDLEAQVEDSIRKQQDMLRNVRLVKATK